MLYGYSFLFTRFPGSPSTRASATTDQLRNFSHRKHLRSIDARLELRHLRTGSWIEVNYSKAATVVGSCAEEANLTDRTISLHTTYLLMLIYSEHLHRSNLRGIPQGRLEGVRGHATPGSGFMVGARKGPGIVSKLKTFRKTPIK